MQSVFVAPPGWSWDIVLYFFFGGLAGGCYFIASMLRLVGGAADLRASRIGYYLAFPLVNVCALLLIKDLGVPERFWHMLLQSEQPPALMFKWWAPISFGSWIVAASGLLPVISFMHALLEGGIVRQRGLLGITAALHDGSTIIGRMFLAIAAMLGLLLAGYTGMLLAVNNAPTWGSDPLLPGIFMASGVATSAAAMFLLSWATSPEARRVSARTRADETSTSGAGSDRFDTKAAETGTRARLLRMAVYALALEGVLVLAGALLSIGHVSPFYLGWWGVLFWVVVLPLGFIAPLALIGMAVFRGRELTRNAVVIGAALILVGGLLFRTFEVLGGQAYFVPY
jgi:formate-dependent nitrite reductase membrane component NrfD